MKKNVKSMKRAELSTSTIVILIIILMGFALVIFFWSQIAWTEQVDSEVCHQSVILRGTLPSTANLNQFVPLKCKTEKVCITSGLFGGSCKEFENVKGVTSVRVKDVHQIEKVISESIIDCWKMMGEGKVSVFSQWLAEKYGLSTVYPSCVICDRIAFDNEGLKKAGIKLEDMNVEEYMRTRAIPDKDLSYYDYLAGENGRMSLMNGDEIPSFDDFKDGKLVVSESKIGGLESLNKENAPSDDNEMAIMFMQITSPKHGESALNIGQIALLGATGSFVAAPSFSMQAATKLGKLCTAGGWVGPVVCSSILVVAGVVQQGTVAYNRALTAGYCGDVSSGGAEREGCSVVRTTKYDARAIKQYCSVIESIP